MSRAICNPCCCPSVEVVEIPGAPGLDLTAVAPAAGDPEGVVVATPGQTYLNTTNDTYWIKKTGTGNTGWIELIGPTA